MPEWLKSGLRRAFYQKDVINIIKYNEAWDEYRNGLKE